MVRDESGIPCAGVAGRSASLQTTLRMVLEPQRFPSGRGGRRSAVYLSFRTTPERSRKTPKRRRYAGGCPFVPDKLWPLRIGPRSVPGSSAWCPRHPFAPTARFACADRSPRDGVRYLGALGRWLYPAKCQASRVFPGRDAYDPRVKRPASSCLPTLSGWFKIASRQCRSSCHQPNHGETLRGTPLDPRELKRDALETSLNDFKTPAASGLPTNW